MLPERERRIETWQLGVDRKGAPDTLKRFRGVERGKRPHTPDGVEVPPLRIQVEVYSSSPTMIELGIKDNPVDADSFPLPCLSL